MKPEKALKILNEIVVNCFRCPRLVHHRETYPPKPIYADEPYWRRPVPGYGDPDAWLMIIGLAPAPHGGNRTGRPFTGDLSAVFLMRCLYNRGFASQPTSEYYDDGLKLLGCYMTAAVKCVPPQHKPLYQEFLNCSPYLFEEFAILKKVTCVLALGRLAFDAYLLYVKAQGIKHPKYHFKHGEKYEFEGMPTLFASYHPSPRNTNTGTMTAEMFEGLLSKIKHSCCPTIN